MTIMPVRAYSRLMMFLGGVAITSFVLVGCAEPTEEPLSTDVVAFTDVNVVPMDHEGILTNHTVLVQNGRITVVAPSEAVDVPSGAQRVDGQGRYLMPGLAEMHGHIPGPNRPEYARNVLFLYIANGVTLVRNMSGNPSHLELREQVHRGELPGPFIYAASPWMTPAQAPGPEEAAQLVRDYHEAGFDLLKMGTISPEAYEGMAEAAHEVGIPFAGHIPEGVGLERALEVGQVSIDHLDRYVEFLVPEGTDTQGRGAGFFGSGWIDFVDRERIALAVEKTIEAGTWNVPTLSLIEHLESPELPEEMIEWPEMRYMPQDVLDSWVDTKHSYLAREDFQPDAVRALVELRQNLLMALHEAGAPIALGSDAPQWFNVPGFSIHHEMQMMVDAGMTPYEVLVTGTRKPAEYFGIPDEFGTVQENRRADLILLEANPLEDIANVQQRAGVMVRGEWLSEEEIQQRLEEIYAERDQM